MELSDGVSKSTAPTVETEWEWAIPIPIPTEATKFLRLSWQGEWEWEEDDSTILTMVNPKPLTITGELTVKTTATATTATTGNRLISATILIQFHNLKDLLVGTHLIGVGPDDGQVEFWKFMDEICGCDESDALTPFGGM